ncbi:MAG: toxin-antitoxin system toxin subunit [Candidatus Eisenbacteria bacterium]|nr:toxin-antitoxin system toxin subunit [Candidatus Eisenbacteria bacterium]
MSILPDILSSRVRAEIFRLLFGVSAQELHMRELERRTGLAIGTIQQELRKLEGMDLLAVRRDGNRVYYSANTAHPLYHDIRNLVLKTSGLVEVLREALSTEDIDLAFVFGSVARGEEGAQGDVDLMVIADVGLAAVSAMLRGVSEKLGREINPHVMSRDEFSERLKSGDRFLGRVVDSPKLFVVGDEDELARLG